MAKETKKTKREPGRCTHNEKCIHEFKDGTTLPDSNELLNIFLIILGIFYILQGIMYYFPWIFSFGTAGNLMSTLIGDPNFAAFAGTLSGNYFVIGGGAFLAGVGMFQEQEWAWGMALIILGIIIAGSIIGVIFGFAITSVIWWLQVLSLAFAAIGIPWLLATKERYY